ncbi:MAG TPA: multidrug effflux MFS transporter [Steroidobacteraceae bacterium]|nr:multidrug effflux MFS transporter [Steroidobacteraceae bacterium]
MVALLATISACGPIALNIYLPALPAVQDAFLASVPRVQLTLSVAFLSFAIGLLVYGPLSDRFGRRPVILVGVGVFTLGTLICFAAPTLDWLIAGRAVQAFGSSAGLIVSRAIVSDLYPREKMVRMIAYLTMVMVVAPTVSPLLGSLLLITFGWRSLFIFMAVAGGAILLTAWLLLPETRALHRRRPTDKSVGSVALALLRRPTFVGYVLQGSVIFSVYLVFISTAPHVMVTGLGRPPTEYGTYFLLLAGGYFLGNWSVTRLAAHMGTQALMHAGVLIAALATCTALGFAAAGLIHPLWLFVPIGVMGYGQGMALPNVTASAVTLAPESAGMASSLVGFAQQLTGAGFVQWISTFAVDTPFPMLIFCASASVAALIALRVLRPEKTELAATRK